MLKPLSTEKAAAEHQNQRLSSVRFWPKVRCDEGQDPAGSINRILSGITPRGPETETVRKLAQTCGVSFIWLNEGIGPRLRAADEDGAILPEVLALAEELAALPAEKLDARSVQLGVKLR